MDVLRDEGDDAEVEADNGGGRERVGDAALEDEIDIHQSVTDDGPAEGERQEDQRKPGELGQQAGTVRSKRYGMTQKSVNGAIASNVPRVSHLSCCRSSADSALR